ncbi:hypothetical protein [Micromonospora sp. NPDC093277]|uniref:hypothetical protein n=1 Tax=Micromonospora sp. NPDC093277 TaxID=3364291 RepID=UPI00381EEDE0
MPEPVVGVDTTYMQGEAFKEFREHAEEIEEQVRLAPTAQDVVPNPESELDQYALKLVEGALEAIHGVAESLPGLTESDGHNVGWFAQAAAQAEESGTQDAQNALTSFTNTH